jgi:aldose 1-epimerase
MSSPPPFSFLPLGAILQSFVVKGYNIVQSFPKQADYVSYNQPYFGETIGRVANRVSAAKIDSLNGKAYQLDANNAPNSLHGGSKGWGKKVWEGPIEEDGGKTVFRLRSEDGDEGYVQSEEGGRDVRAKC